MTAYLHHVSCYCMIHAALDFGQLESKSVPCLHRDPHIISHRRIYPALYDCSDGLANPDAGEKGEARLAQLGGVSVHLYVSLVEFTVS